MSDGMPKWVGSALRSHEVSGETKQYSENQDQTSQLVRSHHKSGTASAAPPDLTKTPPIPNPCRALLTMDYDS